jgi:thioredoxin-related protein
MAPVVDGIRSEYEQDIAFRIYNVEKSDRGAELAEEYQVEYVPTFVFVDGEGTVVNTLVGAIEEDALRTALDRLK